MKDTQIQLSLIILIISLCILPHSQSIQEETIAVETIVLLDEGFETWIDSTPQAESGWINTGWTLDNMMNNPNYGYPHTGLKWLYSWDTDDMLTTPPLLFQSNTELRFFYAVENSGHPMDLAVYLNETQLIYTIQGNTQTTYQEAIVDLSAYKGIYTITFQGGTDDFYAQTIDDILITTQHVPIEYQPLGITKTDNRVDHTAHQGNTINYTITISNPNIQTITDITIQDNFPLTLIYNTETEHQDSFHSYDHQGNEHTVLYHITQLGPGESTTLFLVLDVPEDFPPGITITNTGEVCYQYQETLLCNTSIQQTTIYNKYDVNNDEIVDYRDAGIIWIHRTGELPYESIYDVNADEIVDYRDAGLAWVNRD